MYTSQEIEDVRFVRSDVAIVSCHKQVFDERDDRSDDEPGIPSAGSLTYVLVLEQGTWRIAAAQTTPINYP